MSSQHSTRSKWVNTGFFANLIEEIRKFHPPTIRRLQSLNRSNKALYTLDKFWIDPKSRKTIAKALLSQPFRPILSTWCPRLLDEYSYQYCACENYHTPDNLREQSQFFWQSGWIRAERAGCWKGPSRIEYPPL